MKELQVFENQEFGQIRTMQINGQPWFVGKDVAEALGYSNTRDALANHVEDDDKNTVVNRDGTPGNPNITIINESGMYALIFGSTLQSAKRFKHWVTSEVLPQIRKTGMYAADLPKAKTLRDVINYMEMTRAMMRDQGANSKQIADTLMNVSEHYGLKLPEHFVHPEKTTMKDVFDMIDFRIRSYEDRKPEFNLYRFCHRADDPDQTGT